MSDSKEEENSAFSSGSKLAMSTRTQCRQALCWPLIIWIIFIVIVIICIIFSSRVNGRSKIWFLVIFIILVALWGVLIHLCCGYARGAVAWFLLLLPFTICLLIFVAIILSAFSWGEYFSRSQV